jgi:hypothetical protein
MLTLRQDIFRNGMTIKPKFAHECVLCGHQHKDKVEECENCGSEQLNTPDYAQVHYFEHLDGVSFMERANHSLQSLQDVLENAEWNLDICDNAYLLAVCFYLFDKNGEKSTRVVDELLSLDPRFVEKVIDDYGRPGGRHKVCLKHRHKLRGLQMDRCPEPGCGLKLYDVAWKVRSGLKPEVYYTKDEICHIMKYYPSIAYGTPPIFKILEECQAYMFLTKRVKSYYEKGRPPGIFAVNTPNIKGLEESRQKINAQMQVDAYSIPWLPVDSGSTTSRASSFAQFIPFMQDPSPEMVGVKNEVRRGICSFYGVSPLFQSDVAGSGGLNSEAQQITVFNRTISKGQQTWHAKPLPWLFSLFGITDFEIILNKAERQDDVQDANLQLLKDQHAINMQTLGFSVEMEGKEYRFVRSELGDALMRNPILSRTPAAAPEQVPEAEQTAFQGESKGEPYPNYTGDEDADTVLFCDSMVNKEYMRPRIEQLLRAITNVDMPQEFQRLAPQEAEEVERLIIKAMMDPDGWSVDRIIDKLRKKMGLPMSEDWELRRIVRTETARIANKAHEIEVVERDPPSAKYIWAGPHDRRTSGVCRRIKEVQPPEGLPLMELKELVHRSARELGMEPVGDWVLHPNERHTFRRVFQFSGGH